MNKTLRFAIGIILALAGIGMLVYAASATYKAYPKPAPEDMRKADASQVIELKHFDIIDAASVDGVTRYPAPEAIAAENGDEWVLIEKEKAAACVS